jgi:anti-sigma regulatory factor (Ser/Thr protein kinase)
LPKPGRLTGSLLVEIEDVRWIEALPIAILVAYLKDHSRRNPGTQNWINHHRSVAYLQRMDFFRALGAQLAEGFRRRDSTGRFVPVREVESSAGVAVAADEIVQTLRVDDPDAANTLRHSVGELLDNVFVHARSPVNAVICAQHFPNARRTQIGIVDTGMGFLGSFQETELFREATRGSRDAITLGLAPFITSKPRTHDPYETAYGRLGVGLFIVAEILDSVGGQLLLVSGDTMARRAAGKVRWRAVKPWQGSILGFEVPDEPRVSYEQALRSAREKAREIAARRQARLS